MQFESISPMGYVCGGAPIGRDPRLQNWILVDPNVVVSPFDRMFMYLSDRTHETGMLSLKKPAAFTLVASDYRVGLTRVDVWTQVKAIVDNIVANPSVFAMRSWVDPDSLFLDNIWQTTTGQWEAFVHSYVYDLGDVENPAAIKKQREFWARVRPKLTISALDLGYNSSCDGADDD